MLWNWATRYTRLKPSNLVETVNPFSLNHFTVTRTALKLDHLRLGVPRLDTFTPIPRRTLFPPLNLTTLAPTLNTNLLVHPLCPSQFYRTLPSMHVGSCGRSSICFFLLSIAGIMNADVSFHLKNQRSDPTKTTCKWENSGAGELSICRIIGKSCEIYPWQHWGISIYLPSQLSCVKIRFNFSAAAPYMGTTKAPPDSLTFVFGSMAIFYSFTGALIAHIYVSNFFDLHMPIMIDYWLKAIALLLSFCAAKI